MDYNSKIQDELSDELKNELIDSLKVGIINDLELEAIAGMAGTSIQSDGSSSVCSTKCYTL